MNVTFPHDITHTHNNNMPYAIDSFGRQMHPFGPGGNKGHQGSSGGSGSNLGSKEANLMPVPSPQQIQYLNPLEGQELTIQKQPNTSLRESDLLSPS